MRLLACALLLFGCGGDDDSTEADAAANPPAKSGEGCADLSRSCAEIEATFRGADGVSVSCDEAAGQFEITSTGVPEWDPEAEGEGTPNNARDQDWRGRFPLNPSCAGTPTDTGPTRGPIGLMIDGVPFYGRQDATGGDAYINESDTFDSCHGHADMGGRYHYHSDPPCVFGQGVATSSKNADDGHSPVIGYALDGFALYSGDTAAGEAALDSCNGHFSEARGYHYHSTGTTSPYLAGCFAGEATGSVQ